MNDTRDSVNKCILTYVETGGDAGGDRTAEESDGRMRRAASRDGGIAAVHARALLVQVIRAEPRALLRRELPLPALRFALQQGLDR